MTAIWDASAVTPATTDRFPVDVSGSGAPSRWTGQQVADAASRLGITANALGSINTNTTINLANGHYVTATIAGALTFTFSNPPTTGQGASFVLVLTNGGSAVITWPGSVTWTGATAPTLQSSGVDILRFYTVNAGTNWIGTADVDEQEFSAAAITSGTLALARGGTGASLSDPGADRIAFWDDSAGAVRWLTAGTGLTITDTTITASAGLSEPLTAPRFTGQTSQPSAASAGEAKLFIRQFGAIAAAAYRGEAGDSVALLPSITHPMLRGMWQVSGTTSTSKCWTAFTAGSGFSALAHTVPSLLAINMPTAATGNTNVGRGINGSTLRDGSAMGDGFLTWGLISVPDASYGSGATGAKINMGVQASSGFPSNGNRPGARCAGFEFNTNQSDTNWQAIVYDTAARVVDTGLAFTAQKTYLYIILLPRAGTSTYFHIINLDDGTSGSATVAYTPGSTAMGEYVQLVTLTTTARNLRVSDMWTLVGGAI